MATSDLLGRESERGTIDAMLDGARAGGSQALVIRGEPGIGKSALLDYAAGRAGELTVLRTCGYESESNIPFAGLSDVLRPITAHLADLPGPQRAALESTLALGPSTRTSHFTVCTATLGILAAAAEDTGLLVLVDDAHWLDPSSAEALRFTARRLLGERIAMLLAARPTGAEHRSDAGIPTLVLHGLDADAARALLARRHGRPLSDGQMARLLDVTMGNPLALTEMPELLDAAGDEGPLPPGTSLDRAFQRRLDDLPEATRGALTIAAADQSGELAPITIALDRAEVGVRALEPAERRGIVVIDGVKVAFQHPLLRATVYHNAALADRCAAHGWLAAAYARFTGDHAADARAWHLAAATLAPDDDVAMALHEMAERARHRGAHVEAARAFERAAGLSRSDAARARRLTLAAKTWQLSGRVARCGQLLGEALGLTADPAARAAIQHLRGYVRMWREAPAEVTALLEREARVVEDIDPDRAARMLADAAVPQLMMGDIPSALAMTERAHRISRHGGTTTRRVADVTLAVVRAIRGDRAAAAELLTTVHAWLDVESPVVRAQETIFAAQAAMWLEDFAGARTLLDRLISECRTSSALGVLPYALGLSGGLDLRSGRWQQGVAATTESIRLAEETHQANSYGVFYLAHLQSAMGLRDDAEHNLDRADTLAQAYGIGCMPIFTGGARGLLALGEADIDGALTHLERVRTLEEQLGVTDPEVTLAAGDLAEALVRADRSDDAADVVERVLRPAATAGSRWAAWTAARVDGLRDGTRDAADTFERALAIHDELDWPFERARTAMCYGEVLRRTRRRSEARAQLRAALATFEDLRADSWADRARSELRATGERVVTHHVRGSLHLTPQELQVALAVADGATNQEVAASLFLSTKTIEYHLSKIYRKAGLSSRSELAGLVAGAR